MTMKSMTKTRLRSTGNGKMDGRTPTKTAGKTSATKKRVYFFGGGKAEGRGDQKDLLGGKGANLHDMTSISLPVPPGFTITSQTCAEYNNLGQQLPRGLMDEVRSNL